MTNKEVYELTKYLFESWDRGADYDNYHMDCQFVLEALEEQPAQQGHSCYCPNCEALSKELAELQAQKPIAWRVKWPAIGGGYKWMMVDSPLMEKEGFVNEALYTSPPAQRTWVGLTQEEFRDFASTFEYGTGGLIRAIEAKLKEKNT